MPKGEQRSNKEKKKPKKEKVKPSATAGGSAPVAGLSIKKVQKKG